jgi:phosphate acetyltransferase
MLPTKETERATIAPIAPVGEPPRAKYEHLIVTAKEVPPATTVAVHPCDETSLRGAVDAAEAGIIKPVLVGPAVKIAKSRASSISTSRITRLSTRLTAIPPRRGVQLIHAGKGSC